MKWLPKGVLLLTTWSFGVFKNHMGDEEPLRQDTPKKGGCLGRGIEAL